MIMKRSIFIIFAILFTLSNISAQQNVAFEASNFENESEFKEAKSALLEAYKHYDKGNFYGAIPLLTKAHTFNPNNCELNLKLGVSYLSGNEKQKALKYIQAAFDIDPAFTNKYDLHFAQAHHFLMNFENAQNYYNKYLTVITEPEIIKDINKKISECENGINLREKRNVGTCVNLEKINSEYADYSPMLSADESKMVFTSRRGQNGFEKDPSDSQYYEDIFISYSYNDEWSEPMPISSALNSKTHDSNLGMSNDGQNIFVYNSNNGNGEIYNTKLDGSIWLEPIALPKPINTLAEEKWISISPDQSIIYFVSDREGSNGGLDIFFVEKDIEGNLGKVQNIGDVINTPYDEDGVFIHSDGKSLYFSSKGHNTMGGYDIFKSIKDTNGIWSKPINLGHPINSAGDDRFLFVSANGKTGYFSSPKEGGLGDMDIYKISFFDEDTLMNESGLLLVKGQVIDSQTEKPILADIVIMDNTQQTEIARFKSNKETGKFLISLPVGKDYALTALNTDYLFYSENFNLVDSTNFLEIDLIMKMQKLTENSSSVMRNLFFDYGKSILKPSSQAEVERLYQLLLSQPSMTIEISGHTDNVSSKSFNKILSQKRANAVANYLIQKGINRSRFQTKGYAFSKPIADNKTEEGRQKNRRVEFKILTY